MGQFVRQGVNTQHEGQGAGIVQVLGDQVLAQRNAVQPAGSAANHYADQNGGAENIQ